MRVDLYAYPTPNNFKVTIALEESDVPYTVHLVNLAEGAQKRPEHLALNPNGKTPTLVDPEGPDGKPLAIMESGAILLYLAEKTGRLLSHEPRARSEAIQWLMFQMAGVGPMFGQLDHFTHSAKEKVPYAIDRFTKEQKRLLGVLDGRLEEHDFLAGEAFSVADVATWPWVSSAAKKSPGLLQPFPHLQRWVEKVAERPGVQRGMSALPLG